MAMDEDVGASPGEASSEVARWLACLARAEVISVKVAWGFCPLNLSGGGGIGLLVAGSHI